MDFTTTLTNMTVADLRKVAARFNIAGRSTMKKAELIRELSDPDIADVVELSISLDETAEIESDEVTMKSIIDAEADAVCEQARRLAEYDAEDEAAEIDAALDRDVEAGTYSYTNEVAILRDAPGRAIVTAAFDGRTVGGSIERRGKRLVCHAEGVQVTGNTFEQVAKRLAKALGFHADRIDVARSF